MTDPTATSPRVPMLSILLGFGPAVLLPLLAILSFVVPPWEAWIPITAGQIWGAAILLFLAGVRRGLSFFTVGGPRTIQIVTMAWLFLLGLAGLLLPTAAALLALIVGFGSVALLDPRAARREEVPAHFATLRPPQMLVAMIGLAGLAWRVVSTG
jgi:hypothetical protein